MDMPRRSRSKGRHGSGSSSLSALKPMKQMRVSASTPPTSATSTTPSRIRSAPSAMDGGAGCARHHQRLARALEAEAEGHRVGVRARQDGAKGAPRRARAARSGPHPSTTPPLRTCRRPPPRRGRLPGADRGRRAPRRPAPRPPPRARAGRPSSGAATPRAPSSTSAGTSAATRERSPSVSMAVTGRMAQAPADRPVHRLLTPAPYGLTAPSPLTTTRGDAARVIPARTWTGRSAPGSRGRGTRRSDLRARRSRCRSAPRCPRTAR